MSLSPGKVLRRDAREIFDAALKAADPAGAVMRHLRRLDLKRFRRIYVIGAGKAGSAMALAAEHSMVQHHLGARQREVRPYRRAQAHRA